MRWWTISSCISYFSLHELFLAFICVDNTGSLYNSLFGITIMIAAFSLTSSSSSFSGAMGGTLSGSLPTSSSSESHL